MDVSEICDVTSEVCVVSSLVFHPEYIYFSEQLAARHFTNQANSYIFYAIKRLVESDVKTIDSYNIMQILRSDQKMSGKADRVLTEHSLDEFISNASDIARHTPEGYKLAADIVVGCAFRRATYQKLAECQSLCQNQNESEIEQKIYSTLDNVMMQFTTTKTVPQYRDVVDELWNQICERQRSGFSGIPFKFPTLNQYVTIEPSELVIFAAEAKQGKSMMLLNCAVDLLRRGKRVMYIDSELNSRLFTCRLMAHLAKIEFNRVRSGNYTPEEAARIDTCRDWMKSKSFTHLYMPMFDAQSIFTTVKKVNHTQGIDVLIVDYFKGKGEGDAFDSYQELGRFVDMVKNQICGEMNIAGIGAAQATSTGKVADSAKIGRNASTIAVIQDKTPEEIEADGPECGNKKLRVVLNRNGPQMAQDEYIDMSFNGNLISYEEARQHVVQTPW